MGKAISKSKTEKNIDWDLVNQFKKGLEDLKTGRYERIR